jgi:hypothetical protein
MTHYYCSTFSKGYAYRGLLLYNSLLRWDQDFHFFIICLDDEVKKLYDQMNLKNATLLSMAAVENEDRPLLAVRETRNDQEYAWTSKASVMLHILKHFRETDHIIWLDGDTYFFSNPEPIFAEWGDYSILLTEGRWAKTDKHKIDRYGRYNTGFMGFRRDKHALQCLDWFRSRLLEWCYSKHENNLWSDQVYVNDWLKRFNQVGVIKSMGVNVTPPMIMGSEVTRDGNFVYVNGDRLVFYHYSQFGYYDGNEFELCSFVKHFSDDVVKWIYLPYIRASNDIMEQIRNADPHFYRPTSPRGHFITNYFNLEVNESWDLKFPKICTLLTKDYLIQGLALYYSLKRHTPRFKLWVLCVDQTSYNLLEKMNLAHVTLISLENIRDSRLAKIQRKRQIHEYCWTLKSSLLTYLMKNNYNLDSLLYVDADLYFFKDVRNIYKEWGDHSVFLTKLRLSPKWEQRLGRYSAGLVGFKRDTTGMKCLQSWRQNCLKWCYDRWGNGLWGDQKYLDLWPQTFSNVKISENKGINAGPWNLRKGDEVHGEGNVIYFENMELVCYHCSGFEIMDENEFELCTWQKKAATAEKIYSPYVEEIRKIMARVQSIDDSFFNNTKGKPSKLLTKECHP